MTLEEFILSTLSSKAKVVFFYFFKGGGGVNGEDVYCYLQLEVNIYSKSKLIC